MVVASTSTVMTTSTTPMWPAVVTLSRLPPFLPRPLWSKLLERLRRGGERDRGWRKNEIGAGETLLPPVLPMDWRKLMASAISMKLKLAWFASLVSSASCKTLGRSADAVIPCACVWVLCSHLRSRLSSFFTNKVFFQFYNHIAYTLQRGCRCYLYTVRACIFCSICGVSAFSSRPRSAARRWLS